MSEEKRNFVIVIDLSSFFYDHRRLARIFIKKHIKTIQDLQNRITEVFGIDGFYLSTGGHFLPTLEDVKVINNGETVYVTPMKSKAKELSKVNVSSSTQINSAEGRRLETILPDIPEENIENTSSRKKGSKKRHNNENAKSCSDSEANSSKKMKVKHDGTIDDNIYKSAKQAISTNVTSLNQKQDDSSEIRMCNSHTKKDQHEEQSSANEVLKIKNKLKQKTNEYSEKYHDVTPVKSKGEISGFKGILPKLQNHIKNCNNVGRSNLPDTVRLSRHVDTPMRVYTKRTLPQRITDQYLAKTKTNIVKIDVIEKNLKESNIPNKIQSGPQNITSTEQIKDPNSPPENYVKTVISCFEKNISPNEKTSEIKNGSIENGLTDQNEASNYTKTYLDQKDEERCIPENKFETIKICSVPSKSSSILFTAAKHDATFEDQQSKHLNQEVTAVNISQNITLLPPDSSYSVSTSYNSALNLTNTSMESIDCNRPESKQINANKRYAGIGSLVEHLRESDTACLPEIDNAIQYVTKRKRFRKRKNKGKKTEENEESECISFTKPVPKSIQKSCPNVHIKFESNDFNPTEPKMESVTDSTIETPSLKKTEYDMEKSNQVNSEMTSVTETVVLSDENEEPVLEIKSLFGIDNIANAPLMEHKIEPKLGDIIAFKILKMTESYTPQISTYIIGKVEMYQSESKTIYFRILCGKEELLPVIGKLTSNLVEEEETSNSKSDWKEFKWNEILEPKLLYP